MPLAHPPGHAQVDFGEAVAVIGGVRQKIHFFCMDLPQSDARFVKAYPRGDDGGLPRRACRRRSPSSAACRCRSSTTTPSSRWRRSAATASASGPGPSPSWSSHYLFRDRFGRPGKGNDKGKVEGLVKYRPVELHDADPGGGELRRRSTPCWRSAAGARQGERAGRHAETIGERLAADLAAFRALPAVPLEPCEKRAAARLVDGAGPLPRQRLLGADGLRLPGRCW